MPTTRNHELKTTERFASRYDLEFRPATYWPEVADRLRWLVSRVKGEARRREAMARVEAGKGNRAIPLTQATALQSTDPPWVGSKRRSPSARAVNYEHLTTCESATGVNRIALKGKGLPARWVTAPSHDFDSGRYSRAP